MYHQEDRLPWLSAAMAQCCQSLVTIINWPQVLTVLGSWCAIGYNVVCRTITSSSKSKPVVSCCDSSHLIPISLCTCMSSNEECWHLFLGVFRVRRIVWVLLNLCHLFTYFYVSLCCCIDLALPFLLSALPGRLCLQANSSKTFVWKLYLKEVMLSTHMGILCTQVYFRTFLCLAFFYCCLGIRLL